MRKTLLAAAALAPLCFVTSRTPASAQTTITSNTSAPITTAQDGDITINSGVTIQPTAPNTAAVTLDSSNAVTNLGTIAYKDLNNIVGILVQGGNTGSVTNSGAINITETYAATDSNKDGVNEAPFASTSSTGRYGIQLVGPGAFIGDIINTGTISVQGDASYGISLEAPLVGALTQGGTITYIGDNGAGLRSLSTISGDVLITGGVTALGFNSNAVNFAGAIGGRLSIYSTLTSTDYGLTTRPLTGVSLQTIQSYPTEVNPGAGSALVVSGGVGGGLLIGAPPQYTNTSDPASDADGDGVVDSVEATGSVITYGHAPAIVLGGAAATVFGPFVGTASSPDNGYGVIIEGKVSGLGVYDNVSPTAVQIGGFGATTDLSGGLLVSAGAAVQASGYGTVSAVAIHIGAGSIVRTLSNGGLIEASISPPNSISSTFPAFTATATAISIDPGAVVGALINTGTIEAIISADANDTVSSVAVQDRGGAIASVINTGTITATFSDDTVGATVTGAPVRLANGAVAASGLVALDLSANTTGVTLVQQQPGDTIVTTVTTNSTPTVTVTTAAVPAGTLAITTTATSVTTTTGNTTVTDIAPISPSITGDIYLGNGSNSVSILAGAVEGALSLGNGPTAAVTIDNGAIYYGAMTYGGTSGAGLALNVNNGILDNTSATTFKTSSLTVGAAGILYLAIDPANGVSAFYNVSGAATVAAGGKLGLVFDSNSATPQTFTVIAAGSLNVAGATGAALIGPVPYMFNATLTPNPAAGTLTVSISQKTPSQLGLNPAQSAALGPTYQALTLDTPVQAAFLSQYTRAGFIGVYNQILPDYAGGSFQAANAAALAIGRATSESNDIENPTGSRGAWIQELFIGVNQGVGKTDGFRGGGFGFIGGVETGGSGLGAFGVTSALINTTIADPHVPGDSQTALSELEIGGYWQGEFDGLLADARIGGGYLWMDGRREFVQNNSLGDITLDRKLKDSWSGYTASARFGLAYKWGFGSKFLGGGWFVQPQAHLDAFYMVQNALNESQQQSPTLALALGQVNGHETSGSASVVIGRKLGQGLVFRPQLELGVRDVVEGTAGSLGARYLTGGPTFNLSPADIKGAAGVARFKLKASSEYYELGVEAGGEVLSSRYEEADMKVSVRILF